MDPGHRDRIAFMRLCSGRYQRGMRIYHTRLRKEVRIADALTFMAADRAQADEAYAGDIIGLHNHGTINIGDSFSEGEALVYHRHSGLRTGAVPPRGAEGPAAHEGARQRAGTSCARRAPRSCSGRCATPIMILGAVGPLQFEVVAFRLADEYAVQCVFENINVHTARWVSADSAAKLEEFQTKAFDHLARDHSGALVYLAPSRVNLQLTQERWPDVRFSDDARSPRRCPAADRTPLDRTRARARRAWALTAWANHGFATTVLVGFFPIFSGQVLGGGAARNAFHAATWGLPIPARAWW